MSVHLNADFRDFLLCFNLCKVEYLVVGGYAVIYYGYSRTTGDIDIWVKRTEENYEKIKLAYNKFGMPIFDMTEENFLSNPDMNVFTFGKPPVSIEILTTVKGLEFQESFNNAKSVYWDEVPINVIDLKDLIRAKQASARFKDLEDLENIKE